MKQFKNFTGSMACAVIVSFFLIQCTNKKASAPVAKEENKPAGETVFFDDFSGTTLDTSKWNTEVSGIHVNNELQGYVDSAAVIRLVAGDEAEGAANGALLLQPHYAPGYITKDGQKFDFVSGRINTRNKAEFAYGSFAARIKLTDGAGLWPAWWMLGNGNWPETGEIDIMEYVGEKDWISSAIHGKGYSGDAGIVDRLYFPADNDVTNWHVYAVDWTPDSLLFKYDDVPVLRITKPMTQFFGEWAFDNPKYLILNFAVGGVYPYKINGIKEPFYGLPASTFELIKAGKSKMLVDWVRVTKK
ncbi:MAG: glycoside hydrolase family 16 protein [Chitinophagaceae bacterium]|nr:glycoside hydrolase family 16 protein [Chitinophagaceae bacterium]